MKRLDQGHLHPKLVVPRLTCPGRKSNLGLHGGRRALYKRAILTASLLITFWIKKCRTHYNWFLILTLYLIGKISFTQRDSELLKKKYCLMQCDPRVILLYCFYAILEEVFLFLFSFPNGFITAKGVIGSIQVGLVMVQ